MADNKKHHTSCLKRAKMNLNVIPERMNDRGYGTQQGRDSRHVIMSFFSKEKNCSFLFFFLLWNRIRKRLRCFDLNIMSKMLIVGRFLTRLGLFLNAPLPRRSCLSRSSIENYWSDNVTFYRRRSLSATFFCKKNAGGENNSFFNKIILFYEIES